MTNADLGQFFSVARLVRYLEKSERVGTERFVTARIGRFGKNLRSRLKVYHAFLSGKNPRSQNKTRGFFRALTFLADELARYLCMLYASH